MIKKNFSMILTIILFILYTLTLIKLQDFPDFSLYLALVLAISIIILSLKILINKRGNNNVKWTFSLILFFTIVPIVLGILIFLSYFLDRP